MAICKDVSDACLLQVATRTYFAATCPPDQRLVWSLDAFRQHEARDPLRPCSKLDGVYSNGERFFLIEEKTQRETARQNGPRGNWWKWEQNDLDGLRRIFRERFTPATTGPDTRALCAQHKWAFVLAQLRHAIVTHLYHHDPAAPGLVYRPMFVIPESEQENFDHAYRICDADLRAHGTGPVTPLAVRGPYAYVDRAGSTIPVVALEIPVDNYFGFQPRTQAIPPRA